jgi:hypothetical protein
VDDRLKPNEAGGGEALAVSFGLAGAGEDDRPEEFGSLSRLGWDKDVISVEAGEEIEADMPGADAAAAAGMTRA